MPGEDHEKRLAAVEKACALTDQRMQTVEATTNRIEETNKEYFKKLFGILEGDHGRDGIQTTVRVLAVNVGAAVEKAGAAVVAAEEAKTAAEIAAAKAAESAKEAEGARHKMPSPKWAGAGAGAAVLLAWLAQVVLKKIGWI